MNNKTSQALVLAAATLFSAGLAIADDKTANQGIVKCSGANACKAHSACATAGNACKGMNSCKGKGFIETTAKDCAAKGGHEMKDEKTSSEAKHKDAK